MIRSGATKVRITTRKRLGVYSTEAQEKAAKHIKSI